MKDIKESTIKFRLTAAQKEQIEEYCEKYGMTLSEFARMACERVFQKEGK